MFKRNRIQSRGQTLFSAKPVPAFGLENLETRQLLSASFHHGFGGGFGGGDGGGHSRGAQNTITANLLPGGVGGAIATELDTLSSTTLTATSTVYMGNSNGVETYSIRVSGVGTQAVYTVDVNGNPVTAPTQSTTPFSALSAAVSGEFGAIATDLGLTAPALTATVNVSTPTTGSAVYSLFITGSTGHWGRVISVDAAGNPAGNECVPFESLSVTLQTALNGLAPTGATPLAATSTQNVHVQTIDGVTLYSVTFNAAGVYTVVTVNEGGAPNSLPSSASTTFSALTTTVQTELQTLATADGYTGTIAGTTAVTAYTEANGSVVYAVSVPVSETGHWGNTYTINVTVASDSSGNPTVPAHNDFDSFGGGPFGGFGFGGFEFGGFGFDH